MAKSNSNIENTNVERLEFFIIESLTKKGKIAIPDFGHLELRTVGDRRTVFFVPSEKDGSSFMQVMSAVNEKEKTGANSLYTAVTIPLKAERTISLPKVGVFRPTKRDDGTTRITFIPSASLRKTLSDLENTKILLKEEKGIIEDIFLKDDVVLKDDKVVKDDKPLKDDIFSKDDVALKDDVVVKEDKLIKEDKDIVLKDDKVKKDDIIETKKELDEVKEVIRDVKEDIIEVKKEVKEAVKEEIKEIKVEKTLNARTRSFELPRREPREPVKARISEIKSDTKFKAAELTQKNTETTQKPNLSTPNWPKTAKASETIVPPSTPNTEKFQPPKVERPPKVNDQHISREDVPESHRYRNLSGTVLFFVALIVIIVFVVFNFRSCNIKKVEDQIELTQQQQPVDINSLLSLAEKHYGHPAFWAYIYQANSDKLTSPLNIPENVSLVIPDLEADYNVDITDSMEIKRANVLADMIINRLKVKNNK